MKFIADLHIHSHFSIATSKQLTPSYLDYWARLKGISVVGTGDFTHPGWIKELKETLQPCGNGLFELKEEHRPKELETPFLPAAPVRFMLTAEISNIYKKAGKVRKVHNVVFAPDFETVEKIQQKLTAIGGNITSDGRPILGLDSRDLLEMVLECSENIFFVPAHIWTPWFSILGSKSGFDSVEECYGDLSHHIHAVETGLSTDSPMNRICPFLDNYTLISNSDAHSPEKLGRNANRFDTELSYDGITGALTVGEPPHFQGTIDLFPQEGKYHYDGHRKCGVRWDPVQTLEHNGMCSECGKPVTVGVMNRVVRLSGRDDPEECPRPSPFRSIIPLKEMLSEIEGVGPNSKKVHQRYMGIIKRGRPELEFLLDAPLGEIETGGGSRLAEAVRRMRAREVYVKEGFDGEYGVITVFGKQEAADRTAENQGVLFQSMAASAPAKPRPRKLIPFDLHGHAVASIRGVSSTASDGGVEASNKTGSAGGHTVPPIKVACGDLNPRQWAAVRHFRGPALVIAGPGTGKTRVLTYRVVHLIQEKNIPPEHILAVTFTNKAAAEIGARLEELLDRLPAETGRPFVTTFHALGYAVLKAVRGSAPVILDADDKADLLRHHLDCPSGQVKKTADAVTHVKQQLNTAEHIGDEVLADLFRRYQNQLEALNAVDLDDLIYLPVRLLSEDAALRERYQKKYPWILVDEYQDVNHAQYQLLRLLSPPGGDANLCVIGDPDQAIYSFRGADVRFIQQFRDHYPGAALYQLQKSYRCSDSILRSSGRVLLSPEDASAPSVSRPFLEGVGKGVKIKIMSHPTGGSEAEFTARTVEQMMGGLRFFSMDTGITQGDKETGIESLSDFAVLCRVRSQMETLEKAFLDHTIPYQVVGEAPFFHQEPVKTVLRVLRLARDPGNGFLRDQLLRRNIIAPPGLPPLLEALAQAPSAGPAVHRVVETLFPEPGERERQTFKRLLHIAGDHDAAYGGGGGLESFLKFTALGTAADTYRPGLEAVTFMTLHAAKGLEFPCVFIVGCEDGLLPYALFSGRESDPVEERRLLYVGMTRSQQFLFLSHAEKRFLGGGEHHLGRSPFLDGIEKEWAEVSRAAVKKKEKGPAVQRLLFEQ